MITRHRTAVGGDGAYVTTTITGAQFSAAATVQLSRPGIAEYTPVSYQVVNSTEIIAVFDFTGAPLGQLRRDRHQPGRLGGDRSPTTSWCSRRSSRT